MIDERELAEEKFDLYANNYDAALDRGLSVSGEDKDYFALGRIAWLAGCLHKIGYQPKHLMDFGCGTGSAVPHLFSLLDADEVVGIDVSLQSLAVARETHGHNRTKFLSPDDYQPSEQVDLVFCNGVFHHVPTDSRGSVVRYVYHTLKPGAVFAFWENNPWNPGTRYVMSRCPFDRDAIMLSAIEARRLLRAHGFEVLRTDFLFIFPRILSWLRPLEQTASRLPLGAQYQVLCRKR